MDEPRPNVLAVCARNKKRSRTAEHIFKNDARFNIRSAGISTKSVRTLSVADIHWADVMFVMEKNHRTKVRELFRDVELPPIEVLDIEDLYEFMDEELVAMLRSRIGGYFIDIGHSDGQANEVERR